MPDQPPPANLEKDMEILRKAILEAGEIARDFFQSDFDKWEKSKNNPVTEADIAVDQHLRNALLNARPDYGWLSEETEDQPERLTKQNVWVVDPIDGTRAFVKGRPHFSICGALVHEGRPVLGIVYNPQTNDLFEATLNQGAKRNDEPISASNQDTIEGCRMLGSKDLFRSAKWKNPWPEMHIESFNSIALRMAFVAAGDFDACVALNPKSDWDLAAAEIILQEAGGLCSTHTGDGFIYNREKTTQQSLIAGGPLIQRQVVDRVKHIPLPSV